MKYGYKQSGDTIIEVLLAMSIIGLVLGAAFGIANRSVQIGQNAQERTEALKIAESQLELFKSEYYANTDIQSREESSPFCLSIKAVVVAINEITDAECQNIDGNGNPGLFNVSIIPPNSDLAVDPTGAYEIKVIWSRIGASSNKDEADNNRLSLYYKVGDL